MTTPKHEDGGSERLLELLNGFAISQIVSAAARLGVPGYLGGEELSAMPPRGRLMMIENPRSDASEQFPSCSRTST